MFWTSTTRENMARMHIMVRSDGQKERLLVTGTKRIKGASKMLIYTYLNTPRAEIQDRSAIHYGAAMLNVDDPKRLTGNYFTTRLSRGSMDFEEVVENNN